MEILGQFSAEINKMMTRRPRRNHTPAFKAKVALAALKGSGNGLEQTGRSTGDEANGGG